MTPAAPSTAGLARLGGGSGGDWTCIVCEQTFRADQPRFVDYEADRPHAVDLCIDCSH